MPYSSTASDENIARLADPRVVIDSVNAEFEESTNVLRDWKNKLIIYYELYSLVQRKKHYNGLATIFVPEILRGVETVTAKIYQMIFAQPDWFEYSGRDNNGDEGPALALTALTMYQTEENGFKSRIMDAIRQMVIAGLVVRKVGWDYQEVTRQKSYAKDGKGPEMQVDTIKDTWTLEAVDLLGFQISDINIPYNDIQKAKWIGEEYLVRKEWVSERCRRGWLSKHMKKELSERTEAPASQATDLQREKLTSSGFQNTSMKGKHQIKERWGLCPVEWVLSPEKMKERNYEEGDLIESVIIIGDGIAILKLEENPWWHKMKPYVACPYVPKEGELPGMGASQIGESLQEEINDTRNQTMDNKTLILSTMWLKSRGSGIKNDELTIRPNGVITTNDINGLVPLRPPVVAGVGTNMEGIAKGDLRESIGAASNLQGIAQAGVGTATESSIINRESMGRLFMQGQLFAELIIKPVLVFAEFLNYQFYDHVKMIKVVGPVGVKFRELEPEKIAGGRKDVSIKVSLDSTENPAILRQQYMNWVTLVFGMTPEQLNFHYKSLDKAYGMFFSGHKLEELYPNPNVDESDLLSPEDERNMILAEQPVLAKRGQDHQKHIEYHEAEYGSMMYALSDIQNTIYQKLILSHYQLLQTELMAQQQQFMAQQMLQSGGEAAGGVNKGSTKNTTPHNQGAAPNTASLTKDIGQ